MTNRRKRKPAERSIIYAGALGGLCRDEIAQLLDAARFPTDVPETTIASIRRYEVRVWRIKPEKLGEHIFHPETRSALLEFLKVNGKADSAEQPDREEPEM